jgi:hypothetical protein
MAALFAQMWVLELAAFLLGAAVTWLVFVRPARAAAAAAQAAQPVPQPPTWASGSPADQPMPSSREPVAPSQTADSALAELDAHARHARRSGLFAADVLEQLNNGKKD